VARATFREIAGVPQPAPAPRFSATPLGEPEPAEHPGVRTEAVLADWGFTTDEVHGLVQRDIIV
jgi:alpha-methylacyl-CoA racemase